VSERASQSDEILSFFLSYSNSISSSLKGFSSYNAIFDARWSKYYSVKVVFVA